MGGFGSGRHGYRAIVENGLHLDLTKLIRDRGVVAGARVQGEVTWTKSATGEPIGRINYEASMVLPTDSWVRLSYRVTRKDGVQVQQDDKIRLDSTPLHYGGQRWWFRCPVSGRRTRKLYLPNGATRFCARQEFRLTYQSQCEEALDRSHRRLGRLYLKLGDDYSHFEQIYPARPKGMRRRTYDRLLDELKWQENQHNSIWLIGAARILSRRTDLQKECND